MLFLGGYTRLTGYLVNFRSIAFRATIKNQDNYRWKNNLKTWIGSDVFQE